MFRILKTISIGITMTTLKGSRKSPPPALSPVLGGPDANDSTGKFDVKIKSTIERLSVDISIFFVAPEMQFFRFLPATVRELRACLYVCFVFC